MFFIRFDAVMENDAVVAPKFMALETIRTEYTLFVAISTLSTGRMTLTTLLPGQNVEQAADTKVCRQRSEVSIFRDSEFLPTFRARNHFWFNVQTSSLNPV